VDEVDEVDAADGGGQRWAEVNGRDGSRESVIPPLCGRDTQRSCPQRSGHIPSIHNTQCTVHLIISIPFRRPRDYHAGFRRRTDYRHINPIYPIYCIHLLPTARTSLIQTPKTRSTRSYCLMQTTSLPQRRRLPVRSSNS
jgi:hypothetical protein